MPRDTADHTPEELGQLFRQAWTEAVIRHHPTNPPQAYIQPWAKTIKWEQDTASSTAHAIIDLIHRTDHTTHKLTPDEQSQIVTAIWNAQVHNHHPDPGPSHHTPWNELPTWRRNVNATIFNTLQTWATSEEP